MIDAIHLKGFKRFRDQEFTFGALNVLTGTNASGKSTILQALNLAHQAYTSDKLIVPLVDNPGLHLGSSAELVHYNSNEAGFAIELASDGRQFVFEFDCSDGPRRSLPFVTVLTRPASELPFFSDRFAYHYLSAERLGPRVTLPVNPAAPGHVGVGADGRYVASVLATEARTEVPSGRRHPGASPVTTLVAQTEAWLSQLVGSTQLEASLIPRTSTAALRVRRSDTFGEWMLPTNTGFGISYSLPIIVAALLAPPGAVLAVDSPEAHLHPAAQSAMGEFLSVVAADGVQVLMETHSDHVLNGIRRAIVNDRGPSSQGTAIWFLNDGAPERISVSERGNLDKWPAGFFDQIVRDLGAITRGVR